MRSVARRRSSADLHSQGKSLRAKCPRASHAEWTAPDDRADPVELLAESSRGRIPHLVPVRYGRMIQSPFTFFRGAALNMAADLASTPATGLRVQACGDCHLLNFGAFATPERRVVFDINDFDETLPAPWEWDVKRLASSFVLASRHNGFDKTCAHDAAVECVRSYREHMAEFAAMTVLDIWYAHIELDDVIPTIRDAACRKRIQKNLATARRRSVLEHDYPNLVDADGGPPAIKENPPLIYHWRGHGHEEFSGHARALVERYGRTLPQHRRALLDRFQLVDVAIKVVGIGSVGTWCAVLLLMAGERDPLFLQVKEARPSVLEAFAGRSAFPNHGERVVIGSQLMQSASDLFLGWTAGDDGKHFYVRQLRDVKVKMVVEMFTPGVLVQYATLCGWTLARAHARSGEPARISGYLGKSDAFDRAVAEFAVAYADQTQRDHEAMLKAVRAGRLEVSAEGE